MHGITTTTERNSIAEALDAMLVAEGEYLHNKELALEVYMATSGAQEFAATAERAVKRKQLAHLRPFRKMTEDLLPNISKELGRLKSSYIGKHGKLPVAIRYLKDIDDDVVALIAFREVIDRSSGAASGENGGPATSLRLTAISQAIGSRIQGEARMLAWRKANPKLWDSVQHGLELQHATPIHRQRVNVFKFNDKVREEIGWQDWPRKDLFHVGMFAIEALIRGTVSGEPDDKGHVPSLISIGHAPTTEQRAKVEYDAAYVLNVEPDMMTNAWDALHHEADFHPVYMPMVVKPKQWATMREGGYWHEVLAGKRAMLRFNAINEEQKAFALRDISNADMPKVYDAINTVQEVPWRINRKVYDVAKQVWDNDMAIGGVPAQKLLDPKLVLPRPEAADTDPEIDREWRNRSRDLYAHNMRQPGVILKARRSMAIAERYLDDVFYFPHFLDFRGRMYPIPVDLQPQGQDLARGLLTFAKGKPLDDRGAYWLAIHTANVWGNDKLTFEERIAWIEANDDMLCAVAADPLGRRDWADGGDPWQALAAAMEWADYREYGEGYISSLPIRVDGTCNGIQHLAAMARDEVAGRSVNLTPTDRPKDIYREVGQIVEPMLRYLAEQGGDPAMLAGRWLEGLNGTVPRTLTKRPVMIFPYGGTREAYRKYTQDWLRENDPEYECFPRDLRGPMTRQMCDILWMAIGDKLKGPRDVQKWLQMCARLACSTGIALTWKTPIGFPVRHFYGKRKETRIKTMIDGQQIRLVDWEISAELDVEAHIKGIPPNFVHSMDASVLMATINMSYNAMVDNITCIHDAYGTVAADVDMLNACLRKSFVETYRKPILKLFRDACLDALDGDMLTASAMPPLPQMGSLDIDLVEDSPYFFH